MLDLELEKTPLSRQHTIDSGTADLCLCFLNCKSRFSNDLAQTEKHFCMMGKEGYPPPQLSLVVRKPVFVVFDQVRHKPGCAITEDA